MSVERLLLMNTPQAPIAAPASINSFELSAGQITYAILVLIALVLWRMAPDIIKWLLNRGEKAEVKASTAEQKLAAKEQEEVHEALKLSREHAQSIAQLQRDVAGVNRNIEALRDEAKDQRRQFTDALNQQTSTLTAKLDEVEVRLRADTQRSIADVMHEQEVQKRRVSKKR